MIKTKVRGEYLGLSRQELLDKVYELGANYEKYTGGCSQAPVAALYQILGFDDVVVKAATSLCGGSALQFVGTCGALSGGVIVLDYYFGRTIEYMSDKETIQANSDKLSAALETPKLLAAKFVKEYGTIICTHLQLQLFGRIFYNADPDELDKYLKAGGHSDPTKCIGITGNVARWVLELLLDKGAVEL